MKQYLFIDLDLPQARPLSRFCSVFSLRNGVFSPWQRLRHRDHQAVIYFLHPDRKYEQNIAKGAAVLPYQDTGAPRPDLDAWLRKPQKVRENVAEFEKQFARVIFSSELNVFSILDRIGAQLEQDVLEWSKSNPIRRRFPKKDFQILGSPKGLYLHKEASVLPGVVLDTRNGPIILDAGVEVSPFSYLKGPLYAAPGAYLDNVAIKGGCILGRSARLSGEIENSIIGDFSNKHHEGFVGHSIIGNWVNLGALSTTSDLKNNYGHIRLVLPRISLAGQGDIRIDTGRIKFGSIIGDWVKTAIGTLLNTGTVVDAGSNVFGGSVPKYVLPFSWGLQGERYQLTRFLRDAQKIAARRKQSLPPCFAKLAESLYSKHSKTI